MCPAGRHVCVCARVCVCVRVYARLLCIGCPVLQDIQIALPLPLYVHVSLSLSLSLSFSLSLSLSLSQLAHRRPIAQALIKHGALLIASDFPPLLRSSALPDILVLLDAFNTQPHNVCVCL